MPGLPIPKWFGQVGQLAPQEVPAQAVIPSQPSQAVQPLQAGIPQTPQEDPLGNPGYVGAQRILDNQPDYKMGSQLQSELGEHYTRLLHSENELASHLQNKNMPDLQTTEGINQAMMNTANRLQSPGSPMAGFASMLLPGRARRALAGHEARQQAATQTQFQMLKQLSEMHKQLGSDAINLLGHTNARVNAFTGLGKDLNDQSAKDAVLTLREQNLNERLRENAVRDADRVQLRANDTSRTTDSRTRADALQALLPGKQEGQELTNQLKGFQSELVRVYGPAKAQALIDSLGFTEAIKGFEAQFPAAKSVGGVPAVTDVPRPVHTPAPPPMVPGTGRPGKLSFSAKERQQMSQMPAGGMVVPPPVIPGVPIQGAALGPPQAQPGYGIQKNPDGTPVLSPDEIARQQAAADAHDKSGAAVEKAKADATARKIANEGKIARMMRREPGSTREQIIQKYHLGDEPAALSEADEKAALIKQLRAK